MLRISLQRLLNMTELTTNPVWLSAINAPHGLASKSLLGGVFPKHLRNVEIYEIGVMKNN